MNEKFLIFAGFIVVSVILESISRKFLNADYEDRNPNKVLFGLIPFKEFDLTGKVLRWLAIFLLVSGFILLIVIT